MAGRDLLENILQARSAQVTALKLYRTLIPQYDKDLLRRALQKKEIDVLEEDDPLRESSAAAVERVRQFMLIKELLTATTLGTS